MTGKTSLTGSTIQTRAAVTGVLLKIKVLTLILIPMLIIIIIIMIIIIALSVITRNDNDIANDSKNEDTMMT